MTDLKLAQTSVKMMKVCKGRIEQMDWLKGVIDYQFFMMTFRLNMIQAIAFMVFYFLPLIYIIFANESEWEYKLKLQYSCLVFAGYLTYDEIIQFIFLRN